MKTTVVGIFERPHIDYVVLVIRLSEFGLSCSRIDKIISMIMNIVGVLIKVVLWVVDHDCFAVLILLWLDYFELYIRLVSFVRALDSSKAAGIDWSVVLDRWVGFPVLSCAWLEIARLW